MAYVRLTACALAALAAAGPAPALAATATSNLNVRIEIAGGCVVGAATYTMDFGTQPSTIAANVDVSTDIAVTCNNTTAYTIALDGGTSGDPTARTMVNGANSVTYALFQDAGRSVAWGNTAATDKDATGTGVAQTHTIYGRVGPQTPAATGVYTDTVTITVTF